LGDSAEEDFYALARSLGYRVDRWRNPKPGIDFVARFTGDGISRCRLLQPAFGPRGSTAFSVKSGDCSPSDVRELVDYVSDCRNSNDPTLQAVTGGVIVVGTSKTVGELDAMKSSEIYCWDMKRLVFYSMKVKLADTLASSGRVNEHALTGRLSGGFMFVAQEMKESVVRAEAYAFIDDHSLVVQGDDMTLLLNHIYDERLRPYIQAFDVDVDFRLFVHSVGPVRRQVMEDAYRAFAREGRPRLSLPAEGGLLIQSYSTGPWTAVFRV